jgi:hypothetical protein
VKRLIVYRIHVDPNPYFTTLDDQFVFSG